jgi:hypothetical protein
LRQPGNNFPGNFFIMQKMLAQMFFWSYLTHEFGFDKG